MPNKHKKDKIRPTYRGVILLVLIIFLCLFVVQPVSASPHANMTDNHAIIGDETTIEDALITFYEIYAGIVESAWQENIGSISRHLSPERAIEQSAQTIFPFSGAPVANQIETPTPIPTSSFGEQPTGEPVTGSNRPPLWLTLFLLATCCIMILLFGVIIFGFVLRRQNRRGGNNYQ